MLIPSFQPVFDAMDKVRQRLERTTRALESIGLEYAVIGGNAVAAWVSTIDPGAVRHTRDVNIMIRRADIDRIIEAMETAGFTAHKMRSFYVFTDEDENKKNGVHAIFSGEKVQPSYQHPTPDLAEVVRSPEGFRVLTLEALVRMKLTSFRDRDRTHIRDLLEIGALKPDFADKFPEDLRVRFKEIVDHPETTDWDDL